MHTRLKSSFTQAEPLLLTTEYYLFKPYVSLHFRIRFFILTFDYVEEDATLTFTNPFNNRWIKPRPASCWFLVQWITALWNSQYDNKISHNFHFMQTLWSQCLAILCTAWIKWTQDISTTAWWMCNNTVNGMRGYMMQGKGRLFEASFKSMLVFERRSDSLNPEYSFNDTAVQTRAYLKHYCLSKAVKTSFSLLLWNVFVSHNMTLYL